MSFKENGYSVIKKALDKSLIDYLTKYISLKKDIFTFLTNTNSVSPLNEDYGSWGCSQIPDKKIYNIYGDPGLDTLLLIVKEKMEKEVGCSLIENYSYCRIYIKGNVLEKHTDRKHCEFSTTLNIAGDSWPIFIKNKKSKNVQVDLLPGDMLVYRGCDLEHWREPFTGNKCTQVFLHFNKKNKNNIKNKYDTRPTLGLGLYYKEDKNGT